MAQERAVLGCVLVGSPVDDTGPLPVEAFGHLAEVGGPAFLMSLDQGFLTGNLPSYCATLREYALRRAVVRQAEAAAEAAKNLARQPDAVAAEASARLASLDPGALDEAGDSDLVGILDEWDAVRNGRLAEPYLPLPFRFLHEAGLRGCPENLSVVSGRSGIGKTALLSTCMAYWLWKLPYVGGVFGLEDGTRWLPERWIAHHVGIDYADVGVARLNEWQQEQLVDFYATRGPVLRQKLRAYRRAGITATGLLARCRRWISEGAKWIVIDHGLRIDYEAGGREREDRAIGRTVDALANLAINTRTHIIIAWHLNRASGDDESAPRRADLKESGYLDAAARLILGAWRQSAAPTGGPRTLLTVVKANKVAPEGLTAELEWSGRSGMFKADSGRVVDLQAESAAARDRARQERAAAKRRVKLFDTSTGDAA
jgi:replicative DNA helicase